MNASCLPTRLPIIALWFAGWLTASAAPLETTFTYQGALEVDGAPASGLFDLEFGLFDALESGSPVGDVLVVEDVLVEQGIFSVELDFGGTPFAGDQLWLEIAVREGASSGSFTGLLPRQKITATPYALYAERIAGDSVTGAEIADGSIMAADIGPNAVGSSEIANNSVGSAQIRDGQVQRRVSGTCAPGSQIVAIRQNGTVECDGTSSYAGVIHVAKDGGDFTSVAEALDAIGTDPRYPAASEVDRYLIQVAPGVYEHGPLTMKPYVDIQGSGQGVTVLRSTGGAASLSPDAATLVGASNAELRDITIEIDAAGAGLAVQAIYTTAATTFRNVTANARGGSEARGIVVRGGGVATLVDVIASVSGAADLSIGVDVEFGTLFADGLFVPVSGGADVRGIRLHNTSTDASLENVTTTLSGSTDVSYGVGIRFASVTIDGLRAFVGSTGGTTSFGLLCTGETTVLRLSDARVLVNSAGASGDTIGASVRSCDVEAHGLVVDANATTGSRATGIQIFETGSSHVSNILLADITSRAGASSAPASALEITNGSGSGQVFGLVRDADLSVAGGDPAAASYGLSHAVDGSVQYRGLTIDAGGVGNLVWGIRASDGVARLDDVVIDNTAGGEDTVIGIEFLNDNASASNARIRAINTATGANRDAAGIRVNSAAGVQLTDVSAYVEAETRSVGVNLLVSQARLVRVDARVGGAPTSQSAGFNCGASSVDVRDSIASADVPGFTLGFASFNCNGVIFDSDLIGGDSGILVAQDAGIGATIVVRNSYIKGPTPVATALEGDLRVIGSQLDGGPSSSTSGADRQECTAVTFNSGGTEAFQATTSDPCP